MDIYTGVVENRMDPLKLGRCQVRVVGLHTHDKSKLKTEDLPWAYPMQPLNSAAMSGIGHAPVGIVEGTWVVVTFRDKDKQQPIILGSVGGIPQDFGAVDQDNDEMILTKDTGVATGALTDNSGNIVDTGTVTENTLTDTPDYSGARPSRDFSAVTNECTDLIKQYESLKFVSATDKEGQYSVGYGTTVIDGLTVTQNRRIRTEQQASAYLVADVNNNTLPAVKGLIRTLVTQSMIDALVSLANDRGISAVSNSKLIKELNAGRYLNAAARFGDLNKINGSVDAQLTRRRNAEKALFLSDGIPNVTGDLSPVQETETPVDEGKSTGMSDRGAALQLGFRDPKGKYPLYLKEPDTNRLARNESIGKTIVFKKEASRDKGVEIANSTETWEQSKIPYNTKYPYNKVFFSESGHVLEFDDTEYSERIHLYHKSGTFTEIDANGTQVNRIVGDGYEILERNGYVHIYGSQNVTIEGAQKVKVKNTLDLEVDGATTINIYNNATVNVSGSVDMSVKEDFKLKANTISLEASTINMNATTVNESASTMNVNASGTYNETVGTSHYRWNGTKYSYIGDDTYTVAVSGKTDHSCPTTRSGSIACVTANSAATASTTGLVVPVEPKVPQLPTFSELTVLTRGSETAQVYETPEEGNSDIYRAYQLTTGNLPSDEIDTGSQTQIYTAPLNSVDLLPQSCNLIQNMEKFSPSLVLSKHFTLGRLTSGGTRMPVDQFGLTKQEIVCNLKGLAENCLEPIIELYPNMVISSGFRRPGDVPNSSATSQHYLGQAADIVFPGFSRAEVFEVVKEIQQIIPYDQLLLEYSGSTTVWLHITFKYTGNRKTSFTMRDHKRVSNNGTYTLIT